MALICNDVEMRGRKPARIWCTRTGQPCMFVRYCAVSMKYYQTDDAKRCKARECDGKETGRNADTDADVRL